MRLKKADDRLRDVEVILRLMSFLEYSNFYEGNLKRFLDESMARFNELYDKDSEKIIRLYNSVIETIEILKFFYDEYDNVGRVYRNGKYERFNRVMLEVQVFYFFHLRHTDNIKFKKQLFIDKFKELCENMEFSGTFSSSTKNLVNYRIRYSYFQDLINKTFDLQLDINPF
jgi:hypothetical protein